MPMRSNSALLLAAACAAALAQPPAPDAKLATIEGTVLNSATGAPVPRARVTAMPPSRQTRYVGVTDQSGKFSLHGLPEASYSLLAEHVAFAMPADLTGSTMPRVTVHGGDKTTEVQIKLMPLGSISGRVVNADGEPVDWVPVFAESDGAAAGRPGLTDDKGQFRIADLPPGRYRVRATPQKIGMPPEIRTDGTVETMNAATYYPGVVDAKAAGRVSVQPGADTPGMDIRLVRTPVLRVSGTVTGIPESVHQVMVEESQGRERFSSTVKKDGSFVLWRVEPGRYTLTATGYGAVAARSAPVEITIGDKNVDNVELQMITPATLTGRLDWDGDEKPKPGPTPWRVKLQDVDEEHISESAEVKEDGTFKIPSVTAGRYRVEVTGMPRYVKSMRLGAMQAQGSLLDLRNGASGELVIVMSNATGALAGTVTGDSGPIAGARVLLIGEDREDRRASISGANGAYAFEDLPAGRYKLVAIDAAAALSLEDYEDAMEHIEIEPHDRLLQDLTVQSQFRIGVRR